MTNNGHAWTPGMCWLYCRRTGIPVIWLGPATTEGIHAPMYGCAHCVAELEHMIRQHFAARGGPRASPGRPE
ncbi:hypothetical protein GCM10010232_42380 [Streptomyces amakusaensis]|uniref:Uncharacterized protein n=1 Tax=Streptomyces amakusaensis TaxID=67271 RepID=A0ABW0AIG8_9ACTN